LQIGGFKSTELGGGKTVIQGYMEMTKTSKVKGRKEHNTQFKKFNVRKLTGRSPRDRKNL